MLFRSEKHFNPERGDMFLTEAVAIFKIENGKEKAITPSVEQDHTIFCMGVPQEYCQFLREPEKESAATMAAMTERRELVNRIFEFLMNAIPPNKAFEARQKLNKRNQHSTFPDTEYKVEVMIEYQNYIDPAKRPRFERRIDPLTEATKKEKATQQDEIGRAHV